jgi:AcrR family transcriptional regulator
VGTPSVPTAERIREAAIDLFSRNGFHATGVSELAAAAELGVGALYYHIGSKEQLLWEVLRVHIDEAAAAAEAVLESDLAAVEKMRQLVHHHVRIIAAHAREVRIYVRDAEAVTGDRAEVLQAGRERVEDAWRSVFTEGVAQRVLVTDDHVVVNGVLGMLNMLYMWYRPDREDSPDAIADKLCNVILSGIEIA